MIRRRWYGWWRRRWGAPAVDRGGAGPVPVGTAGVVGVGQLQHVLSEVSGLVGSVLAAGAEVVVVAT